MFSRATLAIVLCLWCTNAAVSSSDGKLENELLQTEALCAVAKQLRKLLEVTETQAKLSADAFQRSSRSRIESEAAAVRAKEAAAEVEGEVRRAAKVAHEAAVVAEAANGEASLSASTLRKFQKSYEGMFSSMLRGVADNGGNETVKKLARECTAAAEDLTHETLKATADTLGKHYNQELVKEYVRDAAEAAGTVEKLLQSSAKATVAAKEAAEAEEVAKEAVSKLPILGNESNGTLGTAAGASLSSVFASISAVVISM